MALKIRLARGGSKKRPFYRIVVSEASAPRDGRFLEKVGTYNPLLSNDNESRVTLDNERILYWISCGAQPTDRVSSFLAKAGLVSAKVKPAQTKKNQPKKKAQERIKMEKAAAEAAAQ